MHGTARALSTWRSRALSDRGCEPAKCYSARVYELAVNSFIQDRFEVGLPHCLKLTDSQKNHYENRYPFPHASVEG